jgi:LysR family nod box-dependent transcriptional activator
MTLRRYDLNLLTVLDALLRHRNVTRAGKEVGLSQSATSHALTRLREQFGDPLLQSSGREMLLTHRAEAISGPLGEALDILDLIFESKSFEPATSIRQFKIGTADYVAVLVVPSLLQRIEQGAPRITTQVTWAEKDIARKLRANQLDLALVPHGTITDEDLHSHTLFTDDLVVVASADHPDIGAELDAATYARLPHAKFRREQGGGVSYADLQLLHSGLDVKASVIVSSFLQLPFVISGTRSVALLHRRLAEKFKTVAGIRILEPPFPTTKLMVQAYWSHAANSDPGHRWYRETLFETCANL